MAHPPVAPPATSPKWQRLGMIATLVVLFGAFVYFVPVALAGGFWPYGGDNGENDVERVASTATPDPTQSATAEATGTATSITATATEEATAEATATQTPAPANPTVSTSQPQQIVSNYDLRAELDSFEHNGWQVQTYEGVTDQMIGWFQNEWLKALAPELWPTFPNVPNPLVPDFKSEECRIRLDPNAEPGAMCVPDGMYYGLDERNVCDNDICDAVVPAGGYLNTSGDYDWGFVSHFAEDDQRGSALLVINVGNVSANFEDIHIDNGYQLEGRYFNGDTLWWGIWSLTSHTTAAMLNYPVEIPDPDGEGRRILNAGDSPDDVNAGANCSVREGCRGVHYTVVITSGNHVLLIATTTFDKDAAKP